MKHLLLWLIGNCNDLAIVESYQWYVHGVVKKDLECFLKNKTKNNKIKQVTVVANL